MTFATLAFASLSVDVARAAEPAESTATIFGKIVDAEGEPLAAAQVSLYRYQPSKSRRWGRWGLSGAPVLSDKSGAYRFPELADGYFMLVAEKTGFARAFCDPSVKVDEQRKVDVVLKLPVSPAIQLTDHTGRPVAGARVKGFEQRGVNGSVGFSQMALKSLGITIPPSDKTGRLQLPPLPTGDVLTVTIDHPHLAPVRIDELTVSPGVVTKATLQPGVTLTLRIPTDKPSHRIASAVIALLHEPWNHPSTTLGYEVDFDTAGTARLAIEPGDYRFFRLEHEDFFLTFTYIPNMDKNRFLRIEPGRNDELSFEVRPKVSARGRVLDAGTGRPIPGASLLGEIENGVSRELRPSEKWSFTGWAETNAKGEYTVPVAAGSARISFHGDKLISEAEYVEFTVAANGSTVIPDIKVRPLSKISGVVQNADGTPAARAVVRLRGKYVNGLQPVLTDPSGRFELQPESVPLDDETGKRAFAQHVVAFDPYRPLAARAEVRLDQPSKLLLKLQPHDLDWPLSEFSDSMTDWERGTVPPEQAKRNAAISLRGRPAFELDGALWLNTNERPLALAGLRGKYVLLDFWFTGCGPCHGDFPSVKMVHELYKDHGVVVIGVHNNSSPPDAVREHVAKIGLPFPVVVDHPDGRTVARYEPHGIPDGYPDYVLIDPDGKVLLDDRTIPHPTLRVYKLEIIRKHLLSARDPLRSE